MKLRTPVIVIGAVWLASGCGARTSYDEFLGHPGGDGDSSSGDGDGDSSSGDGDGDGDGHSGGRSSGGRPGTGGALLPAGGGPIGGSGGRSTGGAGGTGGFIGAGGTPFPGNTCCEDLPYAGCNVPFIQECTCNIDDYCCQYRWDERCVAIANNVCLAGCLDGGSGGVPGSGGGSVGGSGGAFSGNCCATHSSPGCQSMSVTQCVCGLDEFCCNSEWDELCVYEASQCGANCDSGAGGAANGAGGVPGTGGDMGSGGGAQSCNFPGECGSCLCENCSTEMASCQGNDGCLSIAWCVQGSACLPFDCYRPETCQAVIDHYGGLTSQSTQLALSMSVCALGQNCACQ